MPCTTVLVGKKASYDGSTLIARNDDGGFCAKKIAVTEPKDQPKIYKSKIAHLEIELPDSPLRYTQVPSVDLSDGIWPAFGINSANVAMTATETISSNPRVTGADPYVDYKKAEKRGEKDIPGGIGEEDLVAVVLPYIRSAREGVLRVGELLKKYGTYEANGMAFADENEIWWLETIGGHHFLARRVDDEEIVIMPNQFGLDRFDFADAFGAQKNNICSDDMRGFVAENHIWDRLEDSFDPRPVFGSRRDQDRIYNTPRAWYMARYFMPRSHSYDGENADYTPESIDIPWSFKPERRVTVEDIKYILTSHYQGTSYDPYSKSAQAGKYRSIGVPNTDDLGILQIRGYMPENKKGVEWVTLGGSVFTACVPLYSSVSKLPAYISGTQERVSTDSFYWASRLIAALTDAHYATAVIQAERYRAAVFSLASAVLVATDKTDADEKALEEANDKIAKILKDESDKTLSKVLRNASEHMKTRFNRADN